MSEPYARVMTDVACELEEELYKFIQEEVEQTMRDWWVTDEADNVELSRVYEEAQGRLVRRIKAEWGDKE